MKNYKLLLVALCAALLLFSAPRPRGSGGADQVDWPNVYIDASAGAGGVGSEADPYDELADINWTTGGDNSVFDAVAANEDVIIHCLCDEGLHEQMMPTCSGSAAHPVTVRSYGTGARPIIWAIYANSQDYFICEDLEVIGLWLIDGDHWTVDRCINDGTQSLDWISTGATLDLYITVVGAPDVLWVWGDGTTSTLPDPGLKNYGGVATRYGCVICDDWSAVTVVWGDPTSTIVFNLGDLPAGLTGALSFHAATALTGDIGNLPAGLTGYVSLSSATALTGDIGNLPAGITGSVFFSSATALTGDIGDLPAGLTGYVYLSSATALTYTSVAWPLPTANATDLLFNAATFDVGEVNDMLTDLDAHGNIHGSFNIGSGATPTGAGIVAKNNLIAKGMDVTTG